MADGATAATPPDDPAGRSQNPHFRPRRTEATTRPPSTTTEHQANGPAPSAVRGGTAGWPPSTTPPSITPASTTQTTDDQANGRGPSAIRLSPAGTAAPGGNGAGAHVATIDSRRFRSILGRFATGVVAVTAIDPETGRPTGLAANSFTSVSLEPALVSFCVAHTSTTWPRIRGAVRYCVNILSAPQREVCLQLAAKGGDKFTGLGWTESPGGGPVIDGALAWLECSVEAEHVAGDHVIVVSRVHRLDKHHDGDPLIFFRGTYGRFEG
jgi:3-hydroxy-9,10-secoandrosta-1,3,5(10)-triene-9,17-dione monooxygenase reductase component